MQTIRVETLDDPRLDAFARLTDHQLRSRVERERAVMVVESPFAVGVALETGQEPLAFLIDERHERQMAPVLASVGDDVPVFLATREAMSAIVGFKVTRGVMGAFRRPHEADPREVIRGARRIALLEGLVDATNVGAIFRSAAALGVEGVLLDPTCADPYSRRAVRVSMGTVLKVPWATLPAGRTDALAWPRGAMDALREEGFCVCALALADDAIELGDPSLACHGRLALALGTEGWGLSPEALAAVDQKVVIPMSAGVDSLNVGAAAAVAFWELRPRH